MVILAIDPGPTQSAFVAYNSAQRKIVAHDKQNNLIVCSEIRTNRRYDACVIERIASYGKPVGEEVFDTVLWVGRFAETWDSTRGVSLPCAELIYRRIVKMHLCGSNNAKDAHIRQRLIDLFGPGKDVAIGKKKTPGPLYGIKADEWSALALAITFDDEWLRAADAQMPSTSGARRRINRG